MLDDRDRRHLELVHQAARGVEVEQVVERQLLAVDLPHHRQQVRAAAGRRVVRGALVRVLAVRQVHDLLVRAHEQGGEVLLALAEPFADRGVVTRRIAEGLERKRLARAHRELAVGRL